MAWFTGVAGRGQHRRSRCSSGCRSPTSSPATASRGAGCWRARDRAVRAADRRGRRRLPRPPPGRLAPDGRARSSSPTSSSTWPWWCARSAGFWGRLDPGLEEAARTLGAGRWQVARHVTAAAPAPGARWPRRRSCSCSRSRRTASSRCSAGRATRRSRWSCSAGRCCSETFPSRRRSPCCNSSRSVPCWCGGHGPRQRIAGTAAARGPSCRPRDTARQRMVVGGVVVATSRRSSERPLVAPGRCARSAAVRADASPAGAPSGADGWSALATSLRFAVAAALDRHRRRCRRPAFSIAQADGVGASARLRADAAARHLGGHPRLRAADHVRRAAARPAGVRGDRPARPRARRHPLRGAGRAAGGAGDRPRVSGRRRPRSGAGPWRRFARRRVPRSLAARSSPAPGFAFAVSLGRVRRHVVPHPPGQHDAADRDRPGRRPARRSLGLVGVLRWRRCCWS